MPPDKCQNPTWSFSKGRPGEIFGELGRHLAEPRINSPDQGIRGRAYRRPDSEPPQAILSGMRIGDFLLYVFYGNQAFEVAAIVDDGKLFDSMLMELFLRLLQRDSLTNSDQF